MSTSTDCIEKETVLQAPRSRVWRALSNAEEFGSWFGMALEGKEFVPGRSVVAHMTYPGYEHLTCEMFVERMEPERIFSYRWHPYAIDPAVDYSQEPTTLVEFKLDDVEGGTRLRIVESGFDAIPFLRRHEAFRMNTQGWEMQMEDIAKYVTKP